MTVDRCLAGSRFLAGPILDPMGKGERAMRFVEKLHHTEGRLAGQPFRLCRFQEPIVRKVFGDVRPDGSRKVRTVRRGRMVNRVSGDPATQLHERHDAADFETKTQDKLAAAKT